MAYSLIRLVAGKIYIETIYRAFCDARWIFPLGTFFADLGRALLVLINGLCLVNSVGRSRSSFLRLGSLGAGPSSLGFALAGGLTGGDGL